MAAVAIYKASPITRNEPVEDMAIVIGGDIPECNTLEEAENFYEGQASTLAKALFESLPQGTRWRLIIELMKLETKLYRGR